ncbi:MAG TPA: ABC transporter permease [Agrobacterium sp.]|uniref:ABC transporter permease n=1 Tax=Rhizobium sp. TaxID=391 RepID=UPI000E925E6E|nr:ABC transporter permease [Agrobacterium sp.]
MFPDILDVADIRSAIDSYVVFLVANWGDALERAVYPLAMLLGFVEALLAGMPWPLTVAIIVGLAFWSSRSLATTAVVLVLTLFLGVMGFWAESMQTLALLMVSTVLSVILGVPLGIAIAWFGRLRRVVLPLLDLMQTMPSFVYLIPAIMLLGPGKVPALISTVVFALPPLVRLTDLGIRQVDGEVLEASQAFGASPMRQLLGVQLPLALPSIMTGVNQATMMALSMVVIASMIGAGGIGYQVLQGITRLEVGRGLLAGLAIVAIAIIFDRITQGAVSRSRHTKSGDHGEG